MNTKTLSDLLAWNPVCESAFDASGALPVKSVRRSDTGGIIGVVGHDRTVVSNKAIIEDCIQFGNALNVDTDKARVYEVHGGASIRIEFPLGSMNPGGDEIAKSIRFCASHDSTVRRYAIINYERGSCLNVFIAQVVDKGLFAKFSKNHEANWKDRSIRFAQQFLESSQRVEKMIETLQNQKVSAQKARAVIKKWVPGESKRAENTREQISELFHSGRGNAGQTGWDLLNGMTEYANHHRSYKETANVGREENRFLGIEKLDIEELAKPILA